MLIVVLIQNKFSYVVVNDEAAAKDGVSNLEVMEQNYAIGVIRGNGVQICNYH